MPLFEANDHKYGRVALGEEGEVDIDLLPVTESRKKSWIAAMGMIIAASLGLVWMAVGR